jgi:hypothetical protein
VNPLSATRKPYFGSLRAMLLKKCNASTSAMPVTGQTMSDAALPSMIRFASAL